MNITNVLRRARDILNRIERRQTVADGEMASAVQAIDCILDDNCRGCYIEAKQVEGQPGVYDLTIHHADGSKVRQRVICIDRVKNE